MSLRRTFFAVVAIGIFLANPLLTNIKGQPGPQQQQVRRNVRYTCNGETIVVSRCRRDSDRPGYPPTKPEDDYCAVHYPDRPLQNGISVEKVELLADVVKKLQSCGAFDQTPARRQPDKRSTGPSSVASTSDASNKPAAPKSGSMPAMTRAQADAYDKYFNLGNRHLAAKEYGEAVVAYKQAIAVLPDVSYAHNGLGLAYTNLGKYSEAVGELQEAIRLDPDDPTPCLNLAMTYFALKDYTKAITPLQRLIRLKPKDDKAHDLLGTAYKAVQQYDKALVAFREAVRLNPLNSPAWAGLGFSYYYLNRDPEAVSAFQQAIRINPKYSYAYRGLGLTYVGQGRKDEALTVYRTLLTLDKSEAQGLYESISKMVGGGTGRSTP